MTIKVVNEFQNSGDHSFVISGTMDELRTLTDLCSLRNTPSVILGTIYPGPMFMSDGIQRFDRKFTFANPRDAMFFKLHLE